MKLLFDHNISHKLVARVADLFPESTQTRLLNLGRTNDPQLWLIAKTHGFLFVTKDRDVAGTGHPSRSASESDLAFARNAVSMTAVLQLPTRNYNAIEEFVQDPERVVLELFD